ncbi:MAG: proton-conducting transporter membrane subunit [Clostridium sp.]
MNTILVLAPILFPILAGILISIIKLNSNKGRQSYLISVVGLNSILVILSSLTMQGETIKLFSVMRNSSITLRIDLLSQLFAILVSAIWLLVTLYTFKYIEHEKNENRYYTFYLMTLGAVIGVAYSANILTLYLFFEVMTLASVPLVMHVLEKENIKAAAAYLTYSILGASLGLMASFFFSAYQNTDIFTPGGILSFDKLSGKEGLILGVTFLAIIGFSAKAGMMPFHVWLPKAHPVAPAPASAILSGIITKCGIIAVIRVVYYIVGPDFLRGTWVQYSVIGLALTTIFVGSMLAFKEKILKKRLAYSSVSQLSYILFGVMLLTLDGFSGALLQMLFHAVAKTVLFLCVGAIIFMTHKTRVDELSGMGKKMPIVMWCFAIAAISLVGIPPLGGFVSKWYLMTGAMVEGLGIIAYLGPVVLLISALLTAGYLFPIIQQAFFFQTDKQNDLMEKEEVSKFMTIPLIILTAGLIVFGVFSTQIMQVINRIANTIM